jgi:hypothetical protein
MGDCAFGKDCSSHGKPKSTNGSANVYVVGEKGGFDGDEW